MIFSPFFTDNKLNLCKFAKIYSFTFSITFDGFCWKRQKYVYFFKKIIWRKNKKITWIQEWRMISYFLSILCYFSNGSVSFNNFVKFDAKSGVRCWQNWVKFGLLFSQKLNSFCSSYKVWHAIGLLSLKNMHFQRKKGTYHSIFRTRGSECSSCRTFLF